MTTLTQAVGMKHGVTAMPNQASDVRAVTGLLDRIPRSKGGCADAPGKWSADPAVQAKQLGAAIAEFQRVNRRPRADGVLEPGDGTLQLMDTLGAAGKISATIELADVHSRAWVVADPSSVDGIGDVVPLTIAPPLTRRLVRVPGTANPVGNCWHVGGRLGLVRPSFAGSTDHGICPFLLMHGLSKFGR